MAKPHDHPTSEHNKQAFTLKVGVKDAVYTCPICNEPVLTISSNTLSYLKSHVFASQDENGNTSLTMRHPTTTAYHPGEMIRPPFFVIESTSIETFSSAE